MEETFESFIEKERERLAKLRDDTLTRKRELEGQLDNIERELAAIAAYEQVKKGKRPPTTSRAARASSTPRARRGEKRQHVLDFIKQHYPEGATRADLLAEMHIVGNKKEEQSVSNALSALVKEGGLRKDGRRYIVA